MIHATGGRVIHAAQSDVFNIKKEKALSIILSCFEHHVSN